MAKIDQVICFSIEALKKKWPPADETHLKALIEGCKNDELTAWEELFERFVGLILKTINATLEKHGRKDLINDPDVFQDINVKITRKLVADRALDKLRNPLALPHLIELTTQHRTIEWLREQKGKKIVFKREIERSYVHLEKPLTSGKSPLRMKDVVKSEERALDDPDLETQRVLGEALSEIAALRAEERLLMRVVCVFYEGLRDRDIQMIAEKRGIKEEEVAWEIDQLLAVMAERKLERETRRGRETKLWHELRKLERRRKDLAPDALSREEMKKTEEEICAIEEKLEELREKNRSPLRPTNSEIARLLGMNEQEAHTISVKIFKIRKKLAEGLKKE